MLSAATDVIRDTRALLDIAEEIVKLPEDKWEARVQQLPLDQRQRAKRMLDLLKRACR